MVYDYLTEIVYYVSSDLTATQSNCRIENHQGMEDCTLTVNSNPFWIPTREELEAWKGVFPVKICSKLASILCNFKKSIKNEK